jgi:hypothetical protein
MISQQNRADDVWLKLVFGRDRSGRRPAANRVRPFRARRHRRFINLEFSRDIIRACGPVERLRL